MLPPWLRKVSRKGQNILNSHTDMKNEVKIAIAAIIGIGLLFFGINYLKGVNILSPSNTYYVKFKDAQQLAVGNQIYANGYSVGTIRDLEFNYETNDEVVAAVVLNDNVRLPKGTRAELVAPLMGGIVLNIIMGPNPSDLLEPGDTIVGAPHQGALDQVGDLMPVVQEMLPKLDSILANINRLTADPALQQTLANAALITENLKNTSAQLDAMMAGEVPMILGNAETLTGNLARVDVDGTVRNVNGLMTNANTTVTTLNSTVNDAQVLIGMLNSTLGDFQKQLNGTDGSLGLLLNDRSLYNNLNHTMQSADSLVNDLKAHPKRYVHFSVFGKKDK